MKFVVWRRGNRLHLLWTRWSKGISDLEYYYWILTGIMCLGPPNHWAVQPRRPKHTALFLALNGNPRFPVHKKHHGYVIVIPHEESIPLFFIFLTEKNIRPPSSREVDTTRIRSPKLNKIKPPLGKSISPCDQRHLQHWRFQISQIPHTFHTHIQIPHRSHRSQWHNKTLSLD